MEKKKVEKMLVKPVAKLGNCLRIFDVEIGVIDPFFDSPNPNESGPGCNIISNVETAVNSSKKTLFSSLDIELCMHTCRESFP